ncbi:MAG: hypothetical protein AB1324_00900 [Candidatus Micrarchaeota archaeon]
MAQPQSRQPRETQEARESQATQRGIERTPAPANEPISPQLRARLERDLNYESNPGRHTVRSPAVGSRSAELLRLRELGGQAPHLISFANAIYQPEFVHLIPAGQAQRAERVSAEIFRRYIERYPGSGLDENNAVNWTAMDLTRTYIADTENQHNVWTVQPNVYNRTHALGRMRLPRYLAAIHEFMHVEETPPGARSDWDRAPAASTRHPATGTPQPAEAQMPSSQARPPTPDATTVSPRESSERPPASGGTAPAAPSLEILSELMPTIMTIVLSDEVYKAVNRIPIGREVNYGRRVQWDNHSVPLGRVANFYRSLIGQYGSIGAAVASPESLEFMRQGTIPPRMIVPARTP